MKSHPSNRKSIIFKKSNDLKKLLDDYGIKYTENKKLVRGLDYYNDNVKSIIKRYWVFFSQKIVWRFYPPQALNPDH